MKYQHVMESEFAAWNKRAATTIGKVQVEIEPALRGMLTAEQVRDAIERIGKLATLGGVRAERTCSMEYNEYWSGDELYPTEAYQCSVCGHITQEGLPDYCPRCGAKVVEG